MKKLILTTVCLSGLLLNQFNSFAQLSHGGKPVSFGKHASIMQGYRFELLPAVDLTTLKSEDAVNDQNKGPFRFGYNHYVNYNLTNSGSWTSLPDGGRVWQLALKSAGAQSLNLAFDDFHIPTGASMFIYTADKNYVIGAFTSENNDASNKFATDLIPGEAIVIEYFEPVEVLNQGHFNLFRITHGYRGVREYTTKAFGDAGSCQVNVNCPLGANWQNEKRGVVCLVVNGSEFCTGSLVNDVPQDSKPYVLTANHCSASNDFATWVFRFNWEAPGCTNPNTSPSTTQSLNTSTLRARSGGSDFCLVEITGGLSNGTVPASYSPYFNGWSNATIAATSTIGIHHPSGDIKKISEAANTAVTGTYNSADCWRVGLWTTACTEPGSSGSPLFDQNHRIVGQLFGGPSSCTATGTNLVDYYGKFATSWLGGGTSSTQLQVWLDPNSTGTATVDGFDPNNNTPAFALDASIQSINAPANGYSSCNTSLTPEITLRNYGADTLDSCTINYVIDGGTVQTYNWYGSLPTSTSTTVTLNTINGLSVANHTFTSYTSNPNGNSEQNTANDSVTTSFTILSNTPLVTLPQAEGFQSPFPSTNFTIGNPDANATWTKVTSAGGFSASTASAKMNNNATQDITGQSDYIYTSYVDLSSATAPLSLTFDVAYARYNANYVDSLIVATSNDCGNSWTRLYAKGGSGLATAPDNTGTFTPSAGQWRTESVDISSLAGESAIKFAFENKSGWGQSLYLDNINLFAGPLGVANAQLESYFNIYPNPNNGVFNVAINLPTSTAITIKTINVLGKVILTQTLSTSATSIYTVDLSNQAKGIYFVEIATPSQKTVKKVNIF